MKAQERVFGALCSQAGGGDSGPWMFWWEKKEWDERKPSPTACTCLDFARQAPHLLPYFRVPGPPGPLGASRPAPSWWRGSLADGIDGAQMPQDKTSGWVSKISSSWYTSQSGPGFKIWPLLRSENLEKASEMHHREGELTFPEVMNEFKWFWISHGCYWRTSWEFTSKSDGETRVPYRHCECLKNVFIESEHIQKGAVHIIHLID